MRGFYAGLLAGFLLFGTRAFLGQSTGQSGAQTGNPGSGSPGRTVPAAGSPVLAAPASGSPASGSSSLASPTLAKIRAAGELACGVDFEEVEYTMDDAHGNYSAFDLGLCQAVAVAVLGPHAKAKIVPYRDEKDALAGLKSGEIQVLASASVNYINTAALDGVGFTRPVLYDFQGLLVNRLSKVQTVQDLAGKKVCFLVGTEIQAQFQAYMKRQKIPYVPAPFSEEGEMEAALITANCDAITADVTQLAFERIAFRKTANDYVILPDVVAKDPVALAYRTDDVQWAKVVNWVVEALVQAEESGVTQANVAAQQGSEDMVVSRLLGTSRGYGQYLGLDDRWAANVVGAVGNYGELYERTLGPTSIMHLDRGMNRLWTQGGLMYAEPIR